LAPSLSVIKDAHIYAIGDVDKNRQEKGVALVHKLTGDKPKAEYRLKKILENKNIDAVVLATPDHWHAAGTWMALQAGKHVYVEKPCSHNPAEGDVMVAMQKKYGHIVQMGNQQRSSPESREIIKEIHNGLIGETYKAVAFYSNNRGRVPLPNKVVVPSYLDWDEFQGPAPREDYMDIVGDYMWHWYWTWGTAETGNNATHEVDIARWALQEVHPVKVGVNAGKYHFKDDGWTMYDTMEATYHYADGKTIVWDGKSRSAYNTYGGDRGVIIFGTDGTVNVDRGGYKHYNRGGKLVNEKKSEHAEAGITLGGGGDMTTLHMKNFIEVIQGKSDQGSPIEEGAISTNMCHYANISYRAGNRDLDIDPENGKLLDPILMNRYWSREYEKGWEPPI
jgi:predicted dehydrogenase